MATLIDAMLETARAMGIVYESVSTSAGTTTTLIDNTMREPADFFKDGTIWILSGTYAGGCKVIDTYDGGEFSFDAFAGAIASGISYAAAPASYPRAKLKQAVLNALRYKDYLAKDDTLTVVDGQEEYTLPIGVSNVVDVEIALAGSEPYSFIRNMNWREHNGKLIFDQGKYPEVAGMKIRVWYMGYHGEIAETGSVKDGIDLDWLRWKAAEFLYRSKLITIKQDDPTTIELFNETKQFALMAAANAKRKELSSKPQTPHLAAY